MGVDYDSVGGIGILVDDRIVNAFISAGKFTQAEWEYDAGDCINSLKLPYGTAGNAYAGEFRYYIFVDGDSLAEIISNANTFISTMYSLGVDLTYEDLKVISDIYVS